MGRVGKERNMKKINKIIIINAGFGEPLTNWAKSLEDAALNGRALGASSGKGLARYPLSAGS